MHTYNTHTGDSLKASVHDNQIRAAAALLSRLKLYKYDIIILLFGPPL